MNTLVCSQPGEFEYKEVERPVLTAGNAIIKIKRIGICGTDLHAFRGTQPFFSYPRILGHELGVEVLALDPAAPATQIAIGDRCSVEPYLNCGECGACKHGRQNCCVRLQVLGVHTDGGMREYITGPIGLATMQFASLAGARVIVLDINAERLEFCRARGLAAHTIDGRDDPLA